MATLQTNPLHDTAEDDEPITDLQAGCTILGARPASLAVTAAATADTEDVAPSWTGGLGHGCAPVFQPFGSPSRSRGNSTYVTTEGSTSGKINRNPRPQRER